MLLEKNQSICELVRLMEEEDKQGNTKISKYVSYSQRKNINQIDAYINSQHISGKTDSLGREKPFFNIVTAARNIWYRATDIDRKNIKITATKYEHYVLALVARLLLAQWMRKAKFGKWLNEWGRTLATYGSAVSEFIEVDGELKCDVISWNNFICDPIDFDNNPKIKVLWLTPSQLRENKNYDQEQVEYLITGMQSRTTNEGQKVDNKASYIQVYEVYGNLPLSLLTDDDEDWDEYAEQLHVISYLSNKDTSGKYDDYTLYRGKKKNPLRIDHLIKESSRTMGIGAVENLFEAQWMVNHNVKNIKDHLDIASKLITQTADGSFVGQNVLNAVEHGDILVHKPNMPLTRVANTADIEALTAFINQWRQVANEQDNITDAMLGQTKAGDAWRKTETLLQESHSLFELMIENKGLALEDIMREFIIPYIKKKMDTSEEISETLESHNIKQIDSLYVPIKAKQNVKNRIINDILNKTPREIMSGQILTPEMKDMMVVDEQSMIQNSLNSLGNQRFIKPSDIKTKTWKDLLKNFEWDIEIDVTGESKDKQAILTTLNTVLQTIGSNPMILQDEKAKMILSRILEEVGSMSAVEITAIENAPAQPIMQAQPMQPIAQ